MGLIVLEPSENLWAAELPEHQMHFVHVKNMARRCRA